MRRPKRTLLLGPVPFFLLALAECGCQRRLVGDFRLLVLVVNDGRGWRRAWLHVAPALLLVFEHEPYLPFGRVGRVDGVEPLLLRQLPSPATHLLRVRPAPIATVLGRVMYGYDNGMRCSQCHCAWCTMTLIRWRARREDTDGGSARGWTAGDLPLFCAEKPTMGVR
ncbi:hypothetical protein D1007_04101 [Hordeum vulgare]|nr:hypothetical protein D1007_04101 [Hordeum vulgare]